MFTGIVEEIGIIKILTRGPKSAKFTVQGKKIFEDLKIGDSVATNGVCLTATSIENNQFTADIMNQTLQNSSLNNAKRGGKVNLERAMSMKSRFGGHIISGHIDGIGRITNVRREDIAFLYTIKTTDNILKYIVEKGSIGIDGISLTVASVGRDNFTVSIIPHTLVETILGEKKVGDIVNLENDIIGKYVERFTLKK